MAAVGSIPFIQWQGLDIQQIPPQGVPFARATVHHIEGRQSTLGNSQGKNTYERIGILTFQVFGPLGSGKGLTIAESLANIALNAFEGTASPGGIWFGNCRVNEVGVTDGWFQINVVVEFTYDEVK
jgi:hypothetical protein